MKKIFTFSLMMGILTLPSIASAEFIEHDWQNEGDGLATLDTRTGLEWLDLSQTLDISLQTMKTLTQTGGEFENWRLASAQEVQFLATGLIDGITGTSTYHKAGGLLDTPTLDTMKLFGHQNNNHYMMGIYETGDQDTSVFGFAYDNTLYLNSVRQHNLTWDAYHDGVYLVARNGINATLSSQKNASASSDVSTPWSLAALGLAGLLGFRRYKSHTGQHA